MYNVVSKSVADKLDGKVIPVKEFLSVDWTDHVYLIPEDYKTRKCFVGVQLTHTREASMKLLQDKYINNLAMYSIREKDFGDGVVAYWIYLDVIVSVDEYDTEFKKQFSDFVGGK